MALGHAALVREALLDALDQEPDGGVVVHLEGGAQGLQGLAVAVLPHEAIAQADPGVEAARVEGQDGPRRHLYPRPVADVLVDLQEPQKGPRRRGLDLLGALEIGDGLGELPQVMMPVGRDQQRRLEQVAIGALLGMAREEVLRHLYVGRSEGGRVREPPHEGIGAHAVGIGRLGPIHLELANGRRGGDPQAGRRDIDGTRRGHRERGRGLTGADGRPVRALP